MPELSRKDWLLKIWNYHLGQLAKPEMAEMRTLLGRDVEAHADSERVREIIDQQRQTGRWDPSPDFPERMLKSLIQAGERPSVGRRLALIGAVVIGLLVFGLLLARVSKNPVPVPSEPTPVALQPTQAPANDPTPAATKPASPGKAAKAATRSSRFQLKDPVSALEKGAFTEATVFSATLELRGADTSVFKPSIQGATVR